MKIIKTTAYKQKCVASKKAITVKASADLWAELTAKRIKTSK